MELVKFLSYSDHLLENLGNNALFFNNVSAFNDPFEGIFRFRIYSDYQSYKIWYIENQIADINMIDHYFNNKVDLEKLINKNFEWRYENNAVTCLSHESKKTSILMWSHYADKHNGLCLSFDAGTLKFFAPYNDSGIILTDPSGPYEVTYNNDYLDEDPLARELNYKSFLTTKYSEWSTEKEYRFTASEKGIYTYNIDSLKTVIFGLRMGNSHKEEIRKVVKLKTKEASFKKIVLSKSKFEFVIEDD